MCIRDSAAFVAEFAAEVDRVLREEGLVEG